MSNLPECTCGAREHALFHFDSCPLGQHLRRQNWPAKEQMVPGATLVKDAAPIPFGDTAEVEKRLWSSLSADEKNTFLGGVLRGPPRPWDPTQPQPADGSGYPALTSEPLPNCTCSPDRQRMFQSFGLQDIRNLLSHAEDCPWRVEVCRRSLTNVMDNGPVEQVRRALDGTPRRMLLDGTPLSASEKNAFFAAASSRPECTCFGNDVTDTAWRHAKDCAFRQWAEVLPAEQPRRPYTVPAISAPCTCNEPAAALFSLHREGCPRGDELRADGAVDLHRETASIMFGVPGEDVTPVQRAQAKRATWGMRMSSLSSEDVLNMVRAQHPYTVDPGPAPLGHGAGEKCKHLSPTGFSHAGISCSLDAGHSGPHAVILPDGRVLAMSLPPVESAPIERGPPAPIGGKVDPVEFVKALDETEALEQAVQKVKVAEADLARAQTALHADICPNAASGNHAAGCLVCLGTGTVSGGKKKRLEKEVARKGPGIPKDIGVWVATFRDALSAKPPYTFSQNDAEVSERETSFFIVLEQLFSADFTPERAAELVDTVMRFALIARKPS